jgi:hypothetical protein
VHGQVIEGSAVPGITWQHSVTFILTVMRTWYLACVHFVVCVCARTFLLLTVCCKMWFQLVYSVSISFSRQLTELSLCGGVHGILVLRLKLVHVYTARGVLDHIPLQILWEGNELWVLFTNLNKGRFLAADTVWIRSSLFWDVTQRILVASCQGLRGTYQMYAA